MVHGSMSPGRPTDRLPPSPTRFVGSQVRIGCLRERVKDEERKKKREIRDKGLEHLKALAVWG